MAAAKGRIHSAGDDDENEKDQLYNVVMDIEDRYSIWPARLPIPQYWRAEGFSGRKKECLDYIQNVWTDMRPKSLKEDMAKWEAEYEKRKPSPETLKKLEEERIRSMEEGIDHFHKAQPPNDLVKKLMRRQPVEIIRYRDRETGAPDPKKLSAAINRAYVLVKFPHTQGGTELGASLDTTGDGKPDPGSFDYSVAGKVTLKGRLKLDYTPVMLFATVNLDTFKGEGHLEVIPNWKSPQEFRNLEKMKKMEEEKIQKEEEEARKREESSSRVQEITS